VSRDIDVLHLGRDRVICAYELDGIIVDPGPGSCLDTLIDRLGRTEQRGLLLTHIHLDHAGAAGVLAERFPEAELVPVEGRKPLLARLGLTPPAAATSVISTDALLGLAQAAEIRAAWARYGL
jgi:glyoxylase-like metal-dependent hydrolase (beta-lactamase superfamily II)